MRYMGFTDARRTPTGSDGGLDVVASDAVAQVKDYGTTISRPTLQQLVGAAFGRQCLFFSRQGFTREAVEYAADVDMALFRFDLQGTPEPVNATARELLASATDSTHTEDVWHFPVTTTAIELERTARAEVRKRRGEHLVGVYACHLRMEELTYTAAIRGKRDVRSITVNVLIDSLTSQQYTAALPPPEPDGKTSDLLHTRSPDELVDEITAAATRYAPHRIGNADATPLLRRWGVPTDGMTAVLVNHVRSIAVPIGLAAIQNREGTRLAVVNRSTGRVDPQLTVGVERFLPVFVQAIHEGALDRLV